MQPAGTYRVVRVASEPLGRRADVALSGPLVERDPLRVVRAAARGTEAARARRGVHETSGAQARRAPSQARPGRPGHARFPAAGAGQAAPVRHYRRRRNLLRSPCGDHPAPRRRGGARLEHGAGSAMACSSTAFHVLGGEFTLTKSNLGVFGGMFLLIAFAYGLLFSLAGAETPGMHWTQLKLTTFDGFPPERKQRLIRFASASLCRCTLLGLLWSLADEESLSWHDHVSRTFPTPREVDTLSLPLRDRFLAEAVRFSWRLCELCAKPSFPAFLPNPKHVRAKARQRRKEPQRKRTVAVSSRLRPRSSLLRVGLGGLGGSLRLCDLCANRLPLPRLHHPRSVIQPERRRRLRGMNPWSGPPSTRPLPRRSPRPPMSIRSGVSTPKPDPGLRRHTRHGWGHPVSAVAELDMRRSGGQGPRSIME